MTNLVRATFIGEDGSLGYRKGQTYVLERVPSPRWKIAIRRQDGTGYCPYGSVRAFERNWRIEDWKIDK